MKILLISAGTKRKGATARAVAEIEKVLTKNDFEYGKFDLFTESISACCGCDVCRKGMPCIHNDKASDLANICSAYDGYIFFTPVHFGGASGTLKSALGRVFYQAKKSLAFKPAATVAVSRRSGNVTALEEINRFFTFNNMPIVTGNYPAIIYGTSFEEVDNDQEGLQTLRSLAENMIWILKTIEYGKKGGIFHP